jgi:NAD+ synthase (glutamine-hydrolysing)
LWNELREASETGMAINLKIVMAQLDFLVGDIPGNTDKILAAISSASQQNADVLVFPELTLTGYPPEDLLLRPSLQRRIETALAKITEVKTDLTLVIGLPWEEAGILYNVAMVIEQGQVVYQYRKQCLPNYQVFDERRYFSPGQPADVLMIKGVRTGISICEDIWQEGPVERMAASGAELILNLNASPYHQGKARQRIALVSAKATAHNVAIVYTNLVGGQDELVFDGGSFVVNAQGECLLVAPQFEEGLYSVKLDAPALKSLNLMNDEASVYQALVMGVRDYVNKNHFKSVVLGLSGGIDSALTLAVAVDALGADRVRAVMMPFRYTSDMSLADAAEQAKTLGVQYDVVSIEPIYDAFMSSLEPLFEGTNPDTTEENLQARCRGVLLMSLSNKFGSLVLTTGNKSEMSVGYSTLYGDMAGGFDVLKDVPKTLVYRLSQYRNSLSDCIPERVIVRPPSAELAPGQVDQDSLPPYDTLDEILRLYIECDESATSIIQKGFSEKEVNRVIRLVDINEYKRRQAPIGVRITQRGFGKDRRYPITSGWKAGD